MFQSSEKLQCILREITKSPKAVSQILQASASISNVRFQGIRLRLNKCGLFFRGCRRKLLFSKRHWQHVFKVAPEPITRLLERCPSDKQTQNWRYLTVMHSVTVRENQTNQHKHLIKPCWNWCVQFSQDCICQIIIFFWKQVDAVCKHRLSLSS